MCVNVLGVSENEIGINPARPKLGDLANDARDHGTLTWLTYYGRRIAAIVPVEIAEAALNQRENTAQENS